METKARIIKLLVIAACGFLIAAFALAHHSPAAAYELSIYGDTPLIFWVAVVFSLLCGIGVVIQQLMARNGEQKLLFAGGVVLIMLVYVAMLSLWITRGYALWDSGDPLSHLGYIQNLLSNGYIGEDNIYPIAHIYAAEVSLISNLPPVVSLKYMPLLLGILYVPFTYLLARSILPERGHVVLATIAGMAFLGGWFLNFTPNHLSNMVFPLALFLLVMSFSADSFQWKLLFLIVAAVLVPFHPTPTMALLIILLGMWLATRAQYVWRKNSAMASGRNFRFSFAAFAVLLVWFLMWISSFAVWNRVTGNLYRAITSARETPFMGIVSSIEIGAGYGYSVVTQFFRVYGGITVYIILALIGLLFLWKRVSNKEKIGVSVPLYGALVALCLSLVFLYLSPSGSSLGFGAGRFMVYPVLLCTVFAGFTLYELVRVVRENEQSSRVMAFARKTVPLIVIAILVASFANGGLKLYPSRYVLVANPHVTYSEVAGMDWFLHGKSSSMGIESMVLAPGRFADFLLSPSERAQHEYEYLPKHIPGSDDRWRVAAHFGYDRYSSLGEAYDEDVYLVLNEKSKRYQDIFPEVPKFQLTPVDFEKLEQDATVDKLYVNRGFDVWYVHGSSLI